MTAITPVAAPTFPVAATVDPANSPAAASGLYTGSTVDQSTRKQAIDSDVFLKLLVTQLTNQDPSSPMDTNEMIGQTTQLASMEQLTALASTTSEGFALSMRQTSAALIGSTVSYVDETGDERSGVVDTVSFATGVPALTIDGTAVPLTQISGVLAAAS